MTEKSAESRGRNQWENHVRVVLLLDSTERGPIPVLAAALATRLNRMGTRLVVCSLAPHGPFSEKIQGTDTSVVALDGDLDGGLFAQVTSIMRVREVLRRFDPDVVHALGRQSRWIAPLSALGTSAAVIIRAQDECVEGGLVNRAIRWWSSMAGRVSRRLATSLSSSRRRRRYQLSSGTDMVLPETIDAAAARGRPPLEHDLRELPSHLIGAHIGRGDFQCAALIREAFAIFGSRRKRADLVLWGEGAAAALESWQGSQGENGRVHVFDDLPEPERLIRTLDVVWSMDNSDAARLTTLTALAVGVPVVCSHRTDLAGGIREIGGALMRDISWPRQFAEATRDLINDPVLLSALQDAGPKLVDRSHRFHDHALALRGLYESLSSEHSEHSSVESPGEDSGTGKGLRSSSTLT